MQSRYVVVLSLIAVTACQEAVAPKAAGRASGANLANTAPTIEWIGPTAGEERLPLLFQVRVDDAEHDGVTVEIDQDGDAVIDVTTSAPGTPFSTGGGISYPDNGTYEVTVRATDTHGAVTVLTKTIAIANVVPTVVEVVPDPRTVIEVGQEVVIRVRWQDMGLVDAPWRIRVDWADGASDEFTTSDRSASLVGFAHAYTAAGQYAVTATVTDKDGGVSEPVTIMMTVGPILPPTPLEQLEALTQRVQALVSERALNPGEGNALLATLRAVYGAITRGDSMAAEGQLDAFVNKVKALSRNRLGNGAAGQLTAAAEAIKASLAH